RQELDAVERPDAVVLQQGAAQLGERVEGTVAADPAEARLQALVRAPYGVAGSPVAGDAGGFVEDGTQAFIGLLRGGEFLLARLEPGGVVGAQAGQRIAELGERRRGK